MGSVRVRSRCPGRPQIKNLFETIAWRHPHGRRSPKIPPARYHTTKTRSRHSLGRLLSGKPYSLSLMRPTLHRRETLVALTLSPLAGDGMIDLCS